MTTVRELYEALEDLLETEGGSEILIASQPSWPFENHISSVQAVEFVEDHPFEGSNLVKCEICGQHAEHDDHQMTTQIYIVEGGQKGYLPGGVKEAIGW